MHAIAHWIRDNTKITNDRTRPVDRPNTATYIYEHLPTQTNHQSNLEANGILKIVFIFHRSENFIQAYKSSNICIRI